MEGLSSVSFCPLFGDYGLQRSVAFGRVRRRRHFASIRWRYKAFLEPFMHGSCNIRGKNPG